MFLANLGNSGNVCALKSRIGWGLDPHEFGIWLNSSFDFLEVSEINQIILYTILWRVNPSNISLCTTINIINAKEVVTVLE
jgi:hypothetical protein